MTRRRDPELSALMRPWDWFFGSLLVVLIVVNVLYWMHL